MEEISESTKRDQEGEKDRLTFIIVARVGGNGVPFGCEFSMAKRDETGLWLLFYRFGGSAPDALLANPL